DPSFISDSYTECYPSVYEGKYFVYEEEEMDADGTIKKKLKKWELSTGNGVSNEDDSLENVMKSSQYRTKRENTLNAKVSSKRKEQKLDHKLAKITNYMKKKEGNKDTNTPTP